MKVLVIASRSPWPPYSGDRLRTKIWLDAIAPHGEAVLVAPGVVRRSLTGLLRAVVRIVREKLPWQTILAAPYGWSDTLFDVRKQQGPFDATVVVLSRVEPWVRDALPPGVRILDAIDSLARNMHERAREASPLMRWIWRREERRTIAAERSIASSYDHVLFVSEEEAQACGPRGRAVSNGVAVRPLEDKPRRYDFGFWGRLAYFANADAARWLIEEIWPAIREIHPAATMVIAGAAAPASLRSAAARKGVTLLSPVDDMPSLARDVRVAILPLRYGSGESTKLLEAAEAGCAVVATRRGVRSLEHLAPHAVLAEDAGTIAREAVGLLDSANGAALRRAVIAHYSREATLEALAALVQRPAA
jgi:glycosyltransferase involved in cell wall biosynthesis